MAPIQPGTAAPPVPGLGPTGDARVLFFYKVTCPVCSLAAPRVDAFERAYPGRIVGIGQDPEPRLEAFARENGMSFDSVPESPPYDVSNAFGVRTVPTTFLVGADGVVVDTVEAWDREGLNRLSQEVADLTGLPYAAISESTDGLPAFRPG